ncbi:MAG: GNAT family N-acetyltransferase [Chitinophagaceae bacterium]
MDNESKFDDGSSIPTLGTGGVTFVDFNASLTGRFKELNVSWLKKYFVVEPIDEIMLSDPQTYILDKEGHIFFAKLGNEAVGTFALMKTGDGVYELGKMAVDEKFRDRKIGSQMLAYCLEKAKELGALKVTLYSNTRLENALHLYRKFGFMEVPLGSSEYKRSNIKMEINLSHDPSFPGKI